MCQSSNYSYRTILKLFNGEFRNTFNEKLLFWLNEKLEIV